VADAFGFEVLPRRWVVVVWLNRNRRLAKDFEATMASARLGYISPRSSSLGD
jgi:transposase